MSSQNARQQRAEQVATSRIEVTSRGYMVPSQSGNGRYTVQLQPEPTCTCDDYETRRLPCKHILGLQLWLERIDLTKDPEPVCTDPQPKVKRPTYKQDWPAYNAAQTNEKDHFQALLSELCRTIPEPPARQGKGRPPLPLAAAVFCAAFKVYSTFSARRFMCDLDEAMRRGHVGRVPHFNSVLNALDNPGLTPILLNLIRVSGLPLRGLEKQFAVDSSGFCTSRFSRWFDIKYGVTRDYADWVKTHLICGTRTHIVTDVRILEKHTADVSQLPDLVKETRVRFNVEEVSADKAYASADNFQAVEGEGATLYAAFKINATGAVGGVYERMFHLFCLFREEYLAHYHRRSNVESVFSMIKRKFGDSVRSKTDVAMKNEVLCKILCHNICCVIATAYEVGLDLGFPAVPQKDDSPAILRFPSA
jgi:transposase